MRTLVKATALGLGLLANGTAMANDNFGGSPLYNPATVLLSKLLEL